jgi:hypothetical protein
MNDGSGFHFLFGGRFDRHPQAQDVVAIDRFIGDDLDRPRCTTLTKFPVEFSGGRRPKRAAAAGLNAVRVAVQDVTGDRRPRGSRHRRCPRVSTPAPRKRRKSNQQREHNH